MRIARHDGIFKRLIREIPGRPDLAAFQDITDLLGDIQAQMLLIAEQILFCKGVEIFLHQPRNIILAVLALFPWLVVILIAAALFAAFTLAFCQLLFVLITLGAQLRGVSNQHVHFFEF